MTGSRVGGLSPGRLYGAGIGITGLPDGTGNCYLLETRMVIAARGRPGVPHGADAYEAGTSPAFLIAQLMRS